jgi:hypothetical protein
LEEFLSPTYATAGKVDNYWCDQGGIQHQGRYSIGHARLQITITLDDTSG